MRKYCSRKYYRGLFPLTFLSFVIISSAVVTGISPDVTFVNFPGIASGSIPGGASSLASGIAPGSGSGLAPGDISVTVPDNGSVTVPEGVYAVAPDIASDSNSGLVPGNDSDIVPEDVFESVTSSAEDLVRGQRLFYGLVYPENKYMNCASCHNTDVTDSLNWNPDAVEISRKYKNKSVADLTEILLTPTGKKMMEVHRDFRFTPEEIMLVKLYMDELSGSSLTHKKPPVTNLVLFIAALFLFFISAVDLIITKKMKRRWVNPLILSLTTVYITWTLVVNAVALGRSPGYSPDQPVKFSHQIHAEQNGTDCIYCHNYAPYSKSAGIPAQNVCMNCHLLVRSGTRSGMFEITRFIDSYEEKRPLEWIRIHNVPDHVFFSHAQHVGAGGIDCTECHGDIAKMDRVRQESDLSMGWCIKCHRTKKVSFGDNNFYSHYRELSDKLRKGETDSITVERVGGTECMKCHY